MTHPYTAPDATCYELRYKPLFQRRRELAFPCDADGRVQMDKLGDRTLVNYLFARAVVGLEFAPPVVCKRDLQ